MPQLTVNSQNNKSSSIFRRALRCAVASIALVALPTLIAPAAAQSVYIVPVPIFVPEYSNRVFDPTRDRGQQARRERQNYLRENAGAETTFKRDSGNPWAADAARSSARPDATSAAEIRPEYRDASQLRPEFTGSGRATLPPTQ